ncbi:MAG TPA: methylmalonyl-CoA mutase subunit beta [Mycobacteriales bacterium]|nr:methylmalonyl-CoA mutase subunit beta [Mycobacteriales bacterium]
MTSTGAGENLVLAAEFPEAGRDDWLKLVAKVVGVDDLAAAEQALTTTLFDGIATRPLYVAAGGDDVGVPGAAPFVRGTRQRGNLGGWDVRTRHDHPDVATVHEQVVEDLEGGTTSLWLVLGEGAIGLDALDGVLDQAYLDLITVTIDASAEFASAADRYLDLARERGHEAKELSVRFGADPVGAEASSGSAVDIEPAVALAQRASSELPEARAFTVDALPYHEAGADDAQEIACSVAAGVTYLRAMRDAGLSAEAAFGQLEFRYAATADQFLTIAKLRAARQVWSKVAQSCGVTSPVAGQLQHAVSSPSMLTRRDPWNNILRGTLAAFSAGVGGASAITVLPFDHAIGYSDRLARRIARNTHALLMDESNLTRTVDPAGGSWYVEELTREVARSAWSVFQDIERAGGALTALRGGVIGELLERRRAEHLAALADRTAKITGVTEFPLVGEVALVREPRPARPSGGLPRVRWAEAYEAELDRSGEGAS